MREQLPPFVLAELFSNSLVDAGDKLEHVTSNANIQNTNKIYLGNYEKKIVVLVNDNNSIHLNDECLEFLTGILNACKLNLAHIALINFNNHPLSFQQLQKDLQPAFLLSFGVKAL